MVDIYDLANRVGALEALLAAIPPQSPPFNTLAQLDDVAFSGPRAPGDAITFDDTIHKFTNTPSAGSGFPVGPEDDTNGTTEITAEAGGGGSSSSTWSNTNDADASTKAYQQIATATDLAALAESYTAASGASVTQGVGANGGANTAGWQVGVQNNGNTKAAQLEVSANATASRVVANADEVELSAVPGGLNLSGLPTSDPGITGQLWNDSGTVKVSP